MAGKKSGNLCLSYAGAFEVKTDEKEGDGRKRDGREKCGEICLLLRFPSANLRSY